MNQILYLIVIPILVYVVARKIGAHFGLRDQRLLLASASVLFGISVILPSPLIHGEQTEFLTHFFGGGIFMGLIWLYFKPLFRAKAWYHDLIWLYVLTCTFGVLNELYELFSFEMGLNTKPLTDTSWDLFANTLGMLVFYGSYLVILWAKRLFFSR